MMDGPEQTKFVDKRKLDTHVIARNTLFGCNTHNLSDDISPITDPKDQYQLRQATMNLIDSRLANLKQEQEKASKRDHSLRDTMRQTGRPSSSFDFDKDITDCEFAQRVLDETTGGVNSEALMRILETEAEVVVRNINEEYERRVENIPNHGFLGLKGKNPNMLKNAENDKNNRLQNVNQVLDAIQSNWR